MDSPRTDYNEKHPFLAYLQRSHLSKSNEKDHAHFRALHIYPGLTKRAPKKSELHGSCGITASLHETHNRIV